MKIWQIRKFNPMLSSIHSMRSRVNLLMTHLFGIYIYIMLLSVLLFIALPLNQLLLIFRFITFGELYSSL